MNIFSVLSMGKSRLHETSMSAMLAYLLNPNQDHGLGNKFLKSFLELAGENGIYEKYINDDSSQFQIDLEVRYHNKKDNDIDIQIKILDGSYKELHRIIIENKIRAGASNISQLTNYYEAVVNDKNNDDAFELEKENLSVIFLTPKLKNKGLKEEFDNLKSDNKVWLYWNSDDEATTIIKLIQNILELEQKAEISPINEYMKHTLKAFTYFINRTINISSGKSRVGEDIGDIVKDEEINIDNKIYTIILRNSGQIQLLDENGDKVVARPLLRKFLKENNINEDIKRQNTRSFGKQIFEHLENVQTKQIVSC